MQQGDCTMLKFALGEKTGFWYPKENRLGAEIEWTWREIVTTGFRRLSQQPLTPMALQERPYLKRGEILVLGKENEIPKSFYLSAMRGFDADVQLQLVAVNWSQPEDSPEPLGPCFALTPQELGVLNETIRLLRKSLTLPPNYSLRIMPIEVPHD